MRSVFGMSHVAEEAQWIEQAVGGDMEALRRLLERHGPQVREEIDSKIGPIWRRSIDADDVMQVTYIEAFLQIGAMQARDAAGFLAWLRRTAENNLRDAIRELERKKRPPPQGRIPLPGSDESCAALIETLGVDSRTPSRQATAGEARAMLNHLLDQIPADYAQVVRLYDLQGRDIGDVAKEMGRSAGAVHMLRARAHDHLRAILSGSPSF